MSCFIQDYLYEPPTIGKKMVLLFWAPYNPDNAAAESLHVLFRSTAAAAAADDLYHDISFGRMQLGKVCCCGKFSVKGFPFIMLVDEKGNVVERLEGMRKITKTAVDEAVSRLALGGVGAAESHASVADSTADQHGSENQTEICFHHRRAKQNGVKKFPSELFGLDDDEDDDNTNHHGRQDSMHPDPFLVPLSERRRNFFARHRKLEATKLKRNPSSLQVEVEDDDHEGDEEFNRELKAFITRRLRQGSKPRHAAIVNDTKVPSTDDSVVAVDTETTDSDGSPKSRRLVRFDVDPPNDDGPDHTAHKGEFTQPSFTCKKPCHGGVVASKPKRTYTNVPKSTLYLVAFAVSCGGALGVMMLERNGGDPLMWHKGILLASFLVIMAVIFGGNHRIANEAATGAKLHPEAELEPLESV